MGVVVVVVVVVVHVVVVVVVVVVVRLGFEEVFLAHIHPSASLMKDSYYVVPPVKGSKIGLFGPC